MNPITGDNVNESNNLHYVQSYRAAPNESKNPRANTNKIKNPTSWFLIFLMVCKYVHGVMSYNQNTINKGNDKNCLAHNDKQTPIHTRTRHSV